MEKRNTMIYRNIYYNSNSIYNISLLYNNLDCDRLCPPGVQTATMATQQLTRCTAA
jgi:hypothetical protein